MIKKFQQKSFNILYVSTMNPKLSFKLFSSDSEKNSCSINFKAKNETFPHHFVRNQKTFV